MTAMKEPKETGGYFELETYGGAAYRDDYIYLNSARNALRYVLRACHVKELYVPAYTCPVIWDAAREEGTRLRFYDVDRGFMPAEEFPADAYILYNDWFGIGKNVRRLAERYPNLITDNAQSFYAEPRGLASIYSPRKFFGLPDGGLLVTAVRLDGELETDVSWRRASHLLKRHDLGAGAGYGDFQENDRALEHQPVMAMSKLTRVLMGNINYGRVKSIRRANFGYLHAALGGINLLTIQDTVCPMAYPLLVESPGLREKLIAERVYVARYWDGVSAPAAKYLCENLLPLPVDQRCGIDDMERIVGIVKAGM